MQQVTVYDSQLIMRFDTAGYKRETSMVLSNTKIDKTLAEVFSRFQKKVICVEFCYRQFYLLAPGKRSSENSNGKFGPNKKQEHEQYNAK
jgi:hypothetical protein